MTLNVVSVVVPCFCLTSSFHFQHDLDDVQNVVLLKLKRPKDDEDDDFKPVPKPKELKLCELEREDLTCEEVYEN